MRLRLLALSLTFFALPMMASAASGEDLTGSGDTVSGSLLRTESAELKNEREIRTRDFRARMLKFMKSDTELRSREAAFRKDRAEARRDCREELRKANRDGKITVSIRCYREELEMEQEFRAKEAEWLTLAPGVQNGVRTEATDRHTGLTDALDAVILGIEGKVYRSVEDLHEARANLLSKYRTPYAAALTRLRLDMFLTWTQQLIVQIDQHKPAEAATQWMDARLCLNRTEDRLRALLSSPAAPAPGDLRTVMQELTSCRKLLQPLFQTAQ